MRNFHTVVLERLKDFDGSFATEPYEAGWAAEALFFVRVHGVEGPETALQGRVQVSMDGVEWIDEGTVFPSMTAPGDHFVRVTAFGGWLRLRCELTGAARVTIQLQLKS